MNGGIFFFFLLAYNSLDKKDTSASNHELLRKLLLDSAVPFSPSHGLLLLPLSSVEEVGEGLAALLLLGGVLGRLALFTSLADGDSEGSVRVALLLDRSSGLRGHVKLTGRRPVLSGRTSRVRHAVVAVRGIAMGRARVAVGGHVAAVTGGHAGSTRTGGEHHARTAEGRAGRVERHRAHGNGIRVHAGSVWDGGVVRDRLAVGAKGTPRPASNGDGDSLTLEAHHLYPFPTDSISLVLAGLGLHGNVEGDLLGLGPALLGLGEDSLDLRLLLDGTIAAALVLAAAAVLEDLQNL